ncbi:hypothetical protein [Paenochrobactrum pullorum]|uniref:hypothetical protein n=1 Tax=Paenochrobactrum pullorum TaxID=1324351 RepID=UPI0035BBD788
MTFTNAEKSAEFAKFLIEEYRDMSREEQISAIRERFPDIQENEFMRAFAIAEEIAVADAVSSVELLKTDKPLPSFHSDFQCYVRGITYDFESHVGQVHMTDGSCTDMSGTIKFFTQIDADVVTIRTFAGKQPDTIYFVRDGIWFADCGRAA